MEIISLIFKSYCCNDVITCPQKYLPFIFAIAIHYTEFSTTVLLFNISVVLKKFLKCK